MKRLLLTLPAAVMGLVLTSSAKDKTGPSLSSENPSARLQAVRRTQDKWGDHKPAPTADQRAILGRWNHPWTESAFLTFNADGSFQMNGWLRTVEGTYRFLSYDEIELNQPGLFYGRTIVRCEYRLLGDTLELKIYGEWVPYKRAAPAPLQFAAVKEARNKYDTHTPDDQTETKPAEPIVPVIMPPPLILGSLLAGDRQAITGRWNHTWGSRSYYQFGADGTFTREALLYTNKGTWRFSSPQTIELCSPGIFGGSDVSQVEYRLNGDTLEVDEGLGWVAFKKAR